MFVKNQKILVADTGFEPVVPFWGTRAYETLEIGHFSNPQYCRPTGTRTQISTLREWCPNQLDDRANFVVTSRLERNLRLRQCATITPNN